MASIEFITFRLILNIIIIADNGGSSSNKKRGSNVVVARQSEDKNIEEKRSNPINAAKKGSSTGIGAIVIGAGAGTSHNKSSNQMNEKKKSVMDQVDGGNSQRSLKNGSVA